MARRISIIVRTFFAAAVGTAYTTVGLNPNQSMQPHRTSCTFNAQPSQALRKSVRFREGRALPLSLPSLEANATTPSIFIEPRPKYLLDNPPRGLGMQTRSPTFDFGLSLRQGLKNDELVLEMLIHTGTMRQLMLEIADDFGDKFLVCLVEFRGVDLLIVEPVPAETEAVCGLRDDEQV